MAVKRRNRGKSHDKMADVERMDFIHTTHIRTITNRLFLKVAKFAPYKMQLVYANAATAPLVATLLT